MTSASGTERANGADRGRLRRDLAARSLGRILMWVTPILTYAFLWIPILVLVVFSFNDSPSVTAWRGFTLDWYRNIFENTVSVSGIATNFQTELLVRSVRNSLIVASSATIISTAIGTMFALAVSRGSFPGSGVWNSLFYLPVVIPDITLGVALAVFFRLAFNVIETLTGAHMVSGFGTIIIAHVAFNISYVAIVVRARLATMNPTLEEAAADLGANRFQAFWRITFPILMPGILAGGLLAFTLSLDDFVVTFFTAGVGTTTLPLFVYGMLKQRVPPEINAISTLMIVASIILVGFSLLMQGRRRKGDGEGGGAELPGL